MTQHPDRIVNPKTGFHGDHRNVRMSDSNNNPILDNNGNQIWTKECQFTISDGSKIVIQDLFLVRLIIMDFKVGKMYWNALDGSYLLSKVFSKPVGISDIDLFDIRMDREGSTVIISFDLIDKLPDNPPIKWVKGYNRCRCGINFGGVTMIKLEDISTNM